ncbi:MAG TPA: universal stress protein [Thermohalobaculum sp.]|nr:universal stress protein [Thermohalobaculum sp.]
MSKDIVLAVDLNHHESWDAAVPEAVGIARAKGARIHLVVVVPDFGMAMVSDFFPPDFERKALERAWDELHKLAEEKMPEDVEWQAHVAHGDIAEELLRVTGEVGAAMIVMASHPVDHVRHFLVGSQAERIVARSPVSVLVVRQ